MGVKSFKARGKRVTTFAVECVEELEPTRMPAPEDDDDEAAGGGQETDGDAEGADNAEDREESQQDVLDEMTGQLHMFDD